MKTNSTTPSSVSGRQSLFLLCRFLSARFSYRFLLILLSATSVILSVTGYTQFAPYGISLLCLLLPSFLNPSETKQKKENNDTALSVLYQRYHYSPTAFSGYRITLAIGMLLLLVWHKVQNPVVSVFGMSLPLLYLVLCLAMYPLVSRILLFRFHRRLMNGIM